MEKAELKQAFESAKSIDEMLEAFSKMEQNGFQETELGLECCELAFKFHEQGMDPEKIRSFGTRALKTLMRKIKNSSSTAVSNRLSFVIARILNLLGRAAYQLQKFQESLCYLNWAVKNLTKLEECEDDSCPGELVFEILHDVHSEIFRVKTAMGRREEAVEHLRKVVEIKEMTLEEGCVEIGKANHEVAEAYVGIKNYEEAIVFFLRAEEIYMKHFGFDSEKVAQVRKVLGYLYAELKEYDSALELTRLSLNGLKSKGCSSDTIQAEIRNADILIECGRFEEALGALEAVVSSAEKVGDENCRALAFVSMSRAYCKQRKFSEAKKYMRIAQRILEKKKVSSNTVALLLDEMAGLYEDMKDYESAVSLSRKVLTIANASRENTIDCSTRIFKLLSLTGNEKKGVPGLEGVVEKLKEILGPNHCEVGNGYICVAASYLHLGRPETAAKFLTLAKRCNGCLAQPSSVRFSENEPRTFSHVYNYGKCQEKVVEVVKKLGPSHQHFLDNAVGLLNQIKEKAAIAEKVLPKDDEDIAP